MRSIFFLCLGAFIFTSCQSNKNAAIQGGIPACLNKAIKTFSKTGCEKGKSVKEYTFQDKQVFVLDPGNCGADMTTEVLSKECKSLGTLGGITGNTKINGEDFSHAVYVKTVWEK